MIYCTHTQKTYTNFYKEGNLYHITQDDGEMFCIDESYIQLLEE